MLGPAGGPLTGAGFAITAAGPDLTISAGRYWVDGMLVENPANASLQAQPHAPATASPVVLASGNPGPATPSDGVYLLVLETWERLVTAVEDDCLREPALGGPDTVCATEQVWRVRRLRAGTVGTALNCLAAVPGLERADDAVGHDGGTLGPSRPRRPTTARSPPTPASEGPRTSTTASRSTTAARSARRRSSGRARTGRS